MVNVLFDGRGRSDGGGNSGTGRYLWDGKVVILELAMGGRRLVVEVDTDGCG